MRFYKYHGTGNDFIVIDAMHRDPQLSPEDFKALCHRNTGIGADGVILACSAAGGADAVMRIFNADGSEAEMSGNGIRCLARYLYEREKIQKKRMLVETQAGVKRLELAVEDGRVKEIEVDMGMPDFSTDDIPWRRTTSHAGEISISLPGGEEISAVYISMGNPHCVLFVDDVRTAPVSRLGPILEEHELFPRRTNVEFAQPLCADRLLLRIWERGVGETAACGTGACAAFTVALQTGRGESPMRIEVPGGEFILRCDEYGHIHLTGSVVEIYEGELSPYWRG